MAGEVVLTAWTPTGVTGNDISIDDLVGLGGEAGGTVAVGPIGAGGELQISLPGAKGIGLALGAGAEVGARINYGVRASEFLANSFSEHFSSMIDAAIALSNCRVHTASVITPPNPVFDLLPQCFPAGTLVTLFDGTTKTIETVTPSDTVLSHNTNGTAVPGHVTQLLENVTDTWLVLSRVDDPEWSTTVTPGHRYLRPDGSYAEIKDIVSGGSIGDGRIVDVDGHVVEVQAEVVRYSEQTAHLYEQHALYKTQSTGGLALQPEYVEGWRTYNFTVATHHNYVANDIRVHNDSILSFLEEGDVIYALTDDFKDMAVSRDADGDGTREIVLLANSVCRWERFADVNGGDTFLEVEPTFIPDNANADVEALLAA